MSTIQILSNTPHGHQVIINSIKTNPKMATQLAEMGFIPTTPITILNNDYRGPMVVSCRNSKIAISRALSNSIEVVSN